MNKTMEKRDDDFQSKSPAELESLNGDHTPVPPPPPVEIIFYRDSKSTEVDTTPPLASYLRNSHAPPRCRLLAGDIKDEDKIWRSSGPTCTEASTSSNNNKKKNNGGGGGGAADDDDDENEGPLLLFGALVWRAESRAVLLYRKTLEESDVKASQNRLMVTRSESESLVDFLRKKAGVVLDGRKGVKVKVVGVDGRGNVYNNVGVTRWGKATVINSDWRKVVEANEARAGDEVEIWGYTHSKTSKPYMAFYFRRQNININAA